MPNTAAAQTRANKIDSLLTLEDISATSTHKLTSLLFENSGSLAVENVKSIQACNFQVWDEVTGSNAETCEVFRLQIKIAWAQNNTCLYH